MTYKEAEKLKIGDKVISKQKKEVLTIVNIRYHSPKYKIFRLSDGRNYDRLDIMRLPEERDKKAGRNVYLTDKEILALTDTCSEWCSMMSDGDQEACDAVEEQLNNGLGSALKKLYKGRNGYRIYEKY